MDIEDHSVYWHRVKSVWCSEIMTAAIIMIVTTIITIIVTLG